MIHSVPVRMQAAKCETTTAVPRRPGMRAFVPGYSGFRSGSGRAIPHRLLPIGLVTLIVDPDAGPIVTGARERMTEDGPTTWGSGLTIGLTPAGVPALLGVPMSELTGRTLPLSDLLGPRAAELAGIVSAFVSAFVSPPDRVDDLLSVWLQPERHQPDPVTLAAWRRLQRAGGRLPIGVLAAELGVKRRRLERAFREHLGMSPGTVGRIARFQRAVDLIGRDTPLAAAATASGYADQPHLTRETRELAGWTPGELRAFVQYREMSAA